MLKIFVSDSQIDHAEWLEHKLVSSIEEADLVIFTGGSDVNPAHYGETAHPSTSFSNYRDNKEIPMFQHAVALEKPIVGICRGSQLACVMAGGQLIQHQGSLGWRHPIITENGETLEVSSDHHQAAFPYNMSADDYRVIGWTDNKIPFHLDGYGAELNPPKECEIVYYPKIKTLGIQGHPEWMLTGDAEYNKTLAYFRKLTKQLMEGSL